MGSTGEGERVADIAQSFGLDAFVRKPISEVRKAL